MCLREEHQSPSATCGLIRVGVVRFDCFHPQAQGTTASNLARLVDSSDELCRHLLAIAVAQQQAIEHIADAADAARTSSGVEETIKALRAFRQAIDASGRAMFASMWFDDPVLSLLRARVVASGVTQDTFISRVLPRNGALVLLLPPHVRGAKRPAAELVAGEFSASRFVRRHDLPPLIAREPWTTAESWSCAATAILEMSERLSQGWAAIISSCSSAIGRLTGWKPGWSQAAAAVLAGDS
jgi:hypothetical protein